MADTIASVMTGIADAIRSKTGSTDKLKTTEMARAISGITAGDKSTEDGLLDGSLTEYTNDRITKINTNFLATSITSFHFSEVTRLNGYSSSCVDYSITFDKLTSIGNNILAFPSNSNGFNHMIEFNAPALTSIGISSFNQLKGIKKINFPSLKSIGANSFFELSSCTVIKLPAITSLNNSKVMTGFTALKTAVIGSNDADSGNSTEVVPINSQGFFGSKIASGEGYIYVPDSLVDSYKAATNWSTFADQIKPISEYVEEDSTDA